ncbi:MAG: hypothetical protein M3429_02450, partial [Verrucomicrobiota bacterium]|nr:hypothetical protein [Verrucomicrobiota bacterium]
MKNNPIENAAPIITTYIQVRFFEEDPAGTSPSSVRLIPSGVSSKAQAITSANREANNNCQHYQPNGPIRNFEEWKNLCRDL